MTNTLPVAIYSFPAYRAQSDKLAQALQLPCLNIKVHHFPDKESLVTLPEQVAEHAVFCLSLDFPNNKLVELLLAVKTARQQGVKRISLIAPYLSYMRQDKSFHPVEAISQQIIGHWLGELFDDLITVDPHLHRIHSLDEVIPDTNTIVTTAAPWLGRFVESLNQDVILLGPDEESLQWVEQVASVSGARFAVATKTRYSDTHVEIHLPDIDFKDQHIIQVDDVLSSGHTLARAAELLYKKGAAQVDVLVTHALFGEHALQTLKESGIKNTYSTDSIPHPSNCIALTELLAEKVSMLIKG